MSRLSNSLSKPGMLPRQLLREAVTEGYISTSIPFREDAFQPASLDLRVKNFAYRLRAAFLPSGQFTVDASVASLAEHRIDFDQELGGILENNHYYLLPIEESLDLPDTLRGRVSPKSSIGRLDVFVRVLNERSGRFDDIPAGYKGKLYALVGPRSFAIVIRPGATLTQLRLLTTAAGALVPDTELSDFWSRTPLLYSPNMEAPIAYDAANLDEGIFLTADFQRPPRAPLGYRPRRDGALIDLNNRSYAFDKYWAPVVADGEPNSVGLSPDEFYLVRCRERLSIPPILAAEMLPYDPRLGELRSHYAGFFDPGFGYDPSGKVLGTRAVLEVRVQEPFIVRHGHPLCRLQFFRMLEEPDIAYGSPQLGSSYQHQSHPFSKHFVVRKFSGDTQREFDFDVTEDCA
jgi:dCTP deaminase